MIQFLISLAPLYLMFFALQLIVSRNVMSGSFLMILSASSLVFIAFPNAATMVANFLGVGRGADLLLYLLFIVVVFVLVGNLIRFRNQDRQVTTLARKIALSDPLPPN
jgi:small membrane protein